MEALLLLLLSALLASTVALPRQESTIDDRSLLKLVDNPTGKIIPPSGGFRGRDTRILGGKEATRGQFPYQAAIIADQQSFCGGSILSKTWILTAGHCLIRNSRFDVTVGVTNRDDSSENGVTMTSREAHSYPGFSYVTDRDMGVIKLPKELTYTDFIQPTKLPTRADAKEEFVGKTIHISGWGLTSDYGPGGTIQSKLRWATLTIISVEDCIKRFGFKDDSIKDYVGCGYNADGEKTCGGDSGGPHVLEESGVQVGVHSFAAGPCDRTGYPSGYSRTGVFLDWISNTTGIELP